MKYIFLIFVILSFLSCTNNTSYRTRFYLLNNSNKNLRLVNFKDGQPVNEKNISISNNEKILVYTDMGEGKSYLSTSYSNYLLTDSIQVVFSDGKMATHYYINIIGNNTNAIRYPLERNLLNILVNWKKEILLDKEKRTETDYTYTFTNDDYLRAK